MLVYRPATKYTIYPSWSDFEHKWETLPYIFNVPQKYISEQWFNEYNKDNFDLSIDGMRFMFGHVGGGIITHKYIPNPINPHDCTPGKRWLGEAIFNFEQYHINQLSGSDTRKHPLNVVYITRRERPSHLPIKSSIESQVGKQFYIDGSFDHVESVGDNIYVALVCHQHEQQETEMIQDFIDLTIPFDLNPINIKATPRTILKEKHGWFINKKNVFYWFRLKTDIIQVQRIFAFLIYGTLHLRMKYHSIWAVQLAAQIKSKPKGKLFKRST
jgi:hypothetical protein